MLAIKQIITLFAFVVFITRSNGEKQDGIIYILIWTASKYERWNYRNLDNEIGQEAFVRRNCSFQNCYLTTEHEYLKSILDYDVLVFNTVHIDHSYNPINMPTERSERQFYVLFSVEPAAYTSIPVSFDGIFNLTWTYILKSDIVHPYFFVRNKLNEIIAPKIDVHWMDIKKMPPINSDVLQKIDNKRIAAIWVASNCGPKQRLNFVHELNNELSKYGHRVDIYGRCGDQTYCQKQVGGRDAVLTCYSRIESDYYFYLAFENSFTEDYVSEKVLHGLLHFSVPVVYGGANYTRFLPDGIYLNALELGVEGLAREMNNIINDRRRYYNFFKWHNVYSIYDAAEDDYRESVCAFCAFLNDNAKRNKSQIYENISKWWNAPYPDEFSNTACPNCYITPEFKTQEQNFEIETTPASLFSQIIDFFLDFN